MGNSSATAVRRPGGRVDRPMLWSRIFGAEETVAVTTGWFNSRTRGFGALLWFTSCSFRNSYFERALIG